MLCNFAKLFFLEFSKNFAKFWENFVYTKLIISQKFRENIKTKIFVATLPASLLQQHLFPVYLHHRRLRSNSICFLYTFTIVATVSAVSFTLLPL